MPIGINNITTVTMDNLTSIINVTDPMEFYINVNNIIYGGVLVFVLMWVLAVIFYLVAQKREDQPLINAMYSMAVVTVISLLYRTILITKNGVVNGLLSDHQFFVFPIITAILGSIIWALKER